MYNVEATDEWDDLVNYEVDFFVDCDSEETLWEAIMIHDLDEAIQQPTPEPKIKTADDILYSSIDRSKIQE